MSTSLSLANLRELWRYYQIGIINTIFGFGLYALLVRLGINLYLAQLLSHCIGAAFNYFSYSSHVFREAAPAKLRFVMSYIANYLMGLGALAAASQIIRSPYLAGFVAIIAVSLVNFFVLKHLVFKKEPA